MAKVRSNPAPHELEAERQLVEAAQRDPARFGELFELHGRRVYAYVAARVRDRAAAEDVTSEVFHHALKNLKSYEYRGVPFVAWLFRIAANAIAQRGREAAKESGNPIETEPSTDADAERRVIVFSLVSKLPADQQRVIALRYGEQRTLREIADEMQRSEDAVKMLHFRALENLRKHMEDRHER